MIFEMFTGRCQMDGLLRTLPRNQHVQNHNYFRISISADRFPYHVSQMTEVLNDPVVSLWILE